MIDVYRDHILHCERGAHRKARHDDLVRLLVGHLSKAARHLVPEPRPIGRHRDIPNIRVINSHEGSGLFNITFSHPLTLTRIRESVENPPGILNDE